MMIGDIMDIKIGQVWRDKDKRRGTVIEILRIGEPGGYVPEGSVVGIVVGTERETTIKADRLIKRWELLEDKSVRVTQATYMLKLTSSACKVCMPGYKLRMTAGWIDKVGVPLCPHGVSMVEAE